MDAIPTRVCSITQPTGRTAHHNPLMAEYRSVSLEARGHSLDLEIGFCLQQASALRKTTGGKAGQQPIIAGQQAAGTVEPNISDQRADQRIKIRVGAIVLVFSTLNFFVDCLAKMISCSQFLNLPGYFGENGSSGGVGMGDHVA